MHTLTLWGPMSLDSKAPGVTRLHAWIDLVSPRTREVLEGVIARCGMDPETALASGARSTAAAGVVLLATCDEDARDVLFSADFTWLRPLCAETYFKAVRHARLIDLDRPDSAAGLFEAAGGLLMDLGGRLERLQHGDLLRVQSACAGLYVPAMFYGPAFRCAWSDLWKTAERRGLLRHPYLRMQLGTIGSWVGADEPYLEWLLDETVRDFELADAYCFARRDLTGQVFDVAARSIRGDRLDPSVCLLPSRPASTIKHLAEYVVACLRDPRHLRRPAQALKLLTWIEDVHRHVERVKGQSTFDDELPGLRARLHRFERVKLMEKNRFRRLCDTLAEGPVKARLTELWCRTYADGKRTVYPPLLG